jgi:hypothetical protein
LIKEHTCPPAIAGDNFELDCAQVPRNTFVIHRALGNIGNVYQVKIRIDVGASTLQNFGTARKYFWNSPKFSNGKNRGEKNRKERLLHFPEAIKISASKQTVASARVAVLSRMPR